MGEHLPCKQGVKSSNLSISIGYTGKCIRMHLENCILETKKYKKREISNTTSNQEMKERPIIMTLHNDEVKGCRDTKGENARPGHSEIRDFLMKRSCLCSPSFTNTPKEASVHGVFVKVRPRNQQEGQAKKSVGWMPRH